MRLREPKQSKNTRPKPSGRKGSAQPKPKRQANSQAKARTRTDAHANQESKARPDSAPNPRASPNEKKQSSSQSRPKQKSQGKATDRKKNPSVNIESWWQNSLSRLKNSKFWNRPKNDVKPTSVKQNRFWLRHLMTGHLPLQSEVSVFILVGVLDIVMTNLLLRHGAVEANPVARFFLHHWGFRGMIAFKMVTITFVILVAQIVAQHKMSSARRILYCGTAIVGFVVCYSAFLLQGKL